MVHAAYPEERLIMGHFFRYAPHEAPVSFDSLFRTFVFQKPHHALAFHQVAGDRITSDCSCFMPARARDPSLRRTRRGWHRSPASKALATKKLLHVNDEAGEDWQPLTERADDVVAA